MERLWKIFRVIQKIGKLPQVWIPKEKNASNIEQFRTIFLLSVECKTFFKITSVKKGGVPLVPGCIKHTGVVTQ